MDIDYTYYPDSKYLFVIISGKLDWHILQQAAENITTSSDFPSNVNALYDLRELDFSTITSDFENKLILFRKQLNRGDAKIACVVSTEHGFAMGRMYQSLSEDLPQTVQIFRSLDEARNWLTSSI